MNILNSILNSRHYALATAEAVDVTTAAYYNAYLLSNFGIVVDKPNLVNKDTIDAISKSYFISVPSSFYKNPQDTKYFTKDELLIEQLVSYFVYESGNFEIARLEVFKKDLPEYTKGDELVLRTFYIITEDELPTFLKEIMANYCSYTRPWSIQERAEVNYLIANNYYTNEYIACKDNIINLLLIESLKVDASIARFLDAKDIVKMSIMAFGENKTIDKKTVKTTYQFKAIKDALPYVKSCAMSKKQAKYFNKICAICEYSTTKATNNSSPYKAAIAAIRTGNVLEAAKIYAANGSLLGRNIKFLLSRAAPKEAIEILDLLPAKNPIALYQMVSTLTADNGSARTFSFTKNNLVKTHTETEYEATWRKSKLNNATRKLLHGACYEKIDNYYASMEKLGKVYVSDVFDNIGIPTNTSASGKGIDVLPTGSRIKLAATKIRSFCYWNNVFDIDASLILVKEDGSRETIYFGNYADKLSAALRFSGDDRRSSGAEYYDLDLELLKAKGYKYIIQTINGFGGDLNKGEVYAGYQAKKDFNTEVWDPKNIAFQFRVQGNSRAATNFALDLSTNELVILNLVEDNDSRVVNDNQFNALMKYLSPDFLELSIARIARLRGEVVTTPEEADIIFDDNYVAKENQKVIRTYDLEKLVTLVNN